MDGAINIRFTIGLLAVLSFSTVAAAETNSKGIGVLLAGNNSAELQQKFKMKQSLTLDDAFLVQAYGALRAIPKKNQSVDKFFDLVFAKEFSSAAKLLPGLSKLSDNEIKLVAATRLYLFWKLELSQSFFNAWLIESSTNNFLNTELGVALDQIISVNSSQWIIDKAIYLDQEQVVLVDSIKEHESRFNYSVQALRYLRQGHKAVHWLSYLEQGDPLRIELAKTVVLDFAKKGELAKAAGVIKNVFEPIVSLESSSKQSGTERISDYYLLVARLLYQAKAYPASKAYYMSIPDESKNYLQARVEALWISLRSNDHSIILGEIQSLENALFTRKYLPEVSLVSAMANLQLCQFSKVEKSFSEFVRINRERGKVISTNLASSDPAMAYEKDFYVTQLDSAVELRKTELNALVRLGLDAENEPNQVRMISHFNTKLRIKRIREIKRSWSNQQIILESTIRRMRFVKVEFLSKMRRLRSKFAANKQNESDTVSTYSSAIDRANKLEFKYDGVLFGDELFNYSSKVRNLCLSNPTK